MRTLLIAILLSALSVSADERVYKRWLPVAYFNGIDNPNRPIGKALAPGDYCDDETINALKKAQRIDKSITVGCQMWTPNMGAKS